jgi:GDP-L-fucose synthase
MDSNFWQGKKVLITGGTGFIGSYVVEQLLEKGAHVSVTSSSNKLGNIEHVKDKVTVVTADLLDTNSANEALKNQEIVFHLASFKKNIDFHKKHPADVLRINALLAANVLEAAKNNTIERVLIMSSGIVYGPESKSPNKEQDGLLGEVEGAHYGYGWGKRFSEILGKAYAMQYGMKVAIARPYNIYGPRDNFNKESAQVIPALINRIMAKENPFVVWGDGEQERSFLYVEDLARGLIDLAEKYPECDPINFGTDEVILIKDLAKRIMEVVGENLEMQFDLSKPGGLKYRNCDNTKSLEKIGFKPQYTLKEGLQKTIEWYKKNIHSKTS